MGNALANPIRWLPEGAGQAGAELDRLAELHRAGLAVAPIMLVPASSQEFFYRYGNLVARLSEIFRGVDPADPDLDDLEERSPEAMSLITGNYLLDEVIDGFYETVSWLPEARRIRRPGSSGLEARGNRASLLAVKRTWAADWSVTALAERLQETASFRLEAEPVLVHAADGPSGDRNLLNAVARVLGDQTAVFVTGDGSISRLAGISQ